MSTNNQKNNKKRTYIIASLILALIAIISLAFFFTQNNKPTVNQSSETTDLKVSENQTTLEEREQKVDETEYTEYTGYGELTINDEDPYIYLENSENNTVYMQYDVTFEDEIIYSSDLIAPGNMEPVNVYDQLDGGQHTLIYDIDTYDVETRELCMAGVSQEQIVNIEK